MGYKLLEKYDRPQTREEAVANRKQHFAFKQAQEEFYKAKKISDQKLINVLGELRRSFANEF